jgi:hypothetical protein
LILFIYDESDHNSWEPKKNISPDLINQYEDKIKYKNLTTKKETSVVSASPVSEPLLADEAEETEALPITNNEEIIKPQSGIELGLVPEEIKAAHKSLNGELIFIMKWKDTELVEEINADKAKQTYPQLVIKFLEKHLEWCDGTRIDSNNTINNKNISLDDYNFKKKIPERIFGSKYSDSELKFLIKWKDTNDAELVLAEIAYAKWPDIVINFYQSKIKWK